MLLRECVAWPDVQRLNRRLAPWLIGSVIGALAKVKPVGPVRAGETMLTRRG